MKNDSIAKSFANNSIFAVLLQLVNVASGFIVVRIILRFFGSEINGLVTTITQLISYLSLIEAGLANSIINSLYKPLSNSDYKAVNRIISAAKRTYDRTGGVFVILLVALAFILPLFVPVFGLNNLEIICLVIVLGFTGIIDFFTLSKYRCLLNAAQQSYIISIATIIYYFLYTGIIVLCSYLGFSIVIVRLLALLSVCVRTIILSLYCRKKYSFLNFHADPDYKALSKRSSALFLQINGVIQSSIASLVIVVILKDMKVASVYSVYNMILLGVCNLITVAVNNVTANFGSLLAGGKTEELNNVVKKFAFAYYIVISVVFSTTAVMLIPFVKLYTSGIHDANYLDSLLAFLFVSDCFLKCIKAPNGMFIIAAGLFKETKTNTLFQSVILVTFSFVLTPIIGVYGLILASILSNIYRTIDMLVFVPKHTGIRNTNNEIIKIFLSLANVIVFVIAINYIKIEINNYLTWIIMSIIIVISSFVITALEFFFTDKSIFKSYYLLFVSKIKK